jgi:hypothetical protein
MAFARNPNGASPGDNPDAAVSLPRSGVQFLLLAIGVMAAAGAASEESVEERSWTLNFYLENDLFAQTDNDYTSGVRLSWVSPDLVDYVADETLPGWVRGLNDKLTFFHGSTRGLQRNLVLSLGQTIYTPRDRDATDIVEGDRPYAGWLFGSAAYQTSDEGAMDTLEIRLGVVGPLALGKEAQDFVHDLRGFERFKGWDNQLENEPGFTLLWEHRNKTSRIYNSNSRFGFDLIGHAGVVLGNVATYVNAGGEFRLGWSIPDDFGTSSLRPGGDNSTPSANWSRRRTDRDWGVHAFVALNARLVAHNIFLDGNTFRDSHAVDSEPLVADVAAGVSAYYRGVRLSYAQIYHSREFTTQGETHAYGSLALSYMFKF